MPVAELETPVAWTPELDAVLNEPTGPSANAPIEPTPTAPVVPEAKQEATPAEVETPEPEQPGESASAEVAGTESESGVEADDSEPAALDADEVALAKSYGFTDDEIGELASSADLARALAPFERRVMQRTAPETNAPVAPPPREPERKPEQQAPVGELPELSEDEYDPALVKHIKALQAKVQAQEQFIHQRQAEAMQAVEQEQLRTFDALVNNLNDEAKYGGEDWMKRTAEQWAARNALKDATGYMLRGLREQGKQAPLNSALVKRATVYAFPDDIRKQEIAKVQKTIATQSKKRLGKPSGPKRVEIPVGDPEKDPQVMQGLQRVWNEMQAESGVGKSR